MPPTHIIIEKRLEHTNNAAPDASVTLPYDLRQKSRQRVTLDSGEEAGLFLPRGTVLRGGDLLESEDGLIIEVNAAPEQVSVAQTDDHLLMLRACYHLGNRHVPVQIAEHQVRYLHDHVLDEMVRGLGLTLSLETLPFEPEGGAYHSHSHSHSHSHHHEH